MPSSTDSAKMCEPYDMDNFKTVIEVATNKLFYIWIFGFCGMVKIKEPEDIKHKYCEMLKEASLLH